VISGGGGTSSSTSFKISDTFGQGPIGPLAVGTTVELLDGFWATISAQGAPADTLPPGPVVNFQASPQDTSIGLGWTAPSDPDFVGVLIRFSQMGYPDTITDGVAVPYGANGEFLDLPGAGREWVHENLANGATYYYTAFAFDAARNYASGVHVAAAPIDTVAPLPVVSFTATAGDTTVTLNWQNPDDHDFDHAVIRFGTAHAPYSRSEGSPVPNDSNGIFHNVPGSSGIFVHTHLTNGVTYYYSIWSGDEMLNYSGFVDTSATPLDEIPPGQLDYFTAAASGDRAVILRWKNPPDADLEEMLIRYSTSDYPTTPTEGVAIENGNDGRFAAVPAAVDSFVHTGLTAGVAYYYSGFALDEAGNYLSPKGDLATPVDNTPPGLALSVFQNPYVTNHLDLYLIGNEPLVDAEVEVEVNGVPVTMEVNDAVKYVYRGDYDLCCTGDLEIVGCAEDLASLESCDTLDFEVTVLLASSGGTARSRDGAFGFGLPAGAIATDAYFLVSEAEVSGIKTYDVSPAGLALAELAEVSVAYSDDVAQPEHLALARLEDGEMVPLDSYLDRERGRVLAYVSGPGTFGLVARPDVVTPTYGGGKFAILGNAPNPFVGSTGIEFDAGRTGKIVVEILSVDGRHVRTLSDDYVTPGRHSITWDGCDDSGHRVAGGVYLCRAGFGQERSNHKMVHLR
ncbi:MAG: FlgD immunoglobulin-like domain containing protein, partial [bacterium]